MGVAFDAQVTDYNNALARPASQTFSHTCTGSNRYLFLAVACTVNGAITGVTYNGVAMTELGTFAAGPGFMSECIIYGLANPASGANTVSIQTSGTGNVAIYTAVASYTGVNQTTPNPHSGSNSTAGATSLTLSIDTSTSPATNGCWIVCGSFTDGNYTASAGAGTTMRSSGTTDDWVGIYDNNILISPAGSDSLVTAISTSSEIYMLGVSLAPVATSITLTDGLKLGDVISAGKVLMVTMLDGLKLGDTLSSVKGKILTIIDGLKIGEIFSSFIDEITRWTNRTKPSTIFTNRTKPSTTFTDRTKPSTTWTKIDRR